MNFDPDRFEITINGRRVNTQPAHVSAIPFNRVWPGAQRPIDQTETAWFATFDMDAPAVVTVRVLDGSPMDNIVIRPQEYGIRPAVEGDTITFTVPRPMQLSVEVGGVHRCLMLFANPVCETVNPNDPDVLYFGPGKHTAGLILPKSGQTVFLAEGAVVYGTIYVYHADNVRILGRGVLDSSPYRRGNDPAPGGQEVHNALKALGISDEGIQYVGNLAAVECRNLLIEGITLRDSQFWSVNIHNNCEYVTLDNVKVVGQWRYNSDGMDICASSHVTVKNCFVRAFDDCLITRPRHLEGDLDKMVDMRVENCVLWCDWGRSIEVWFGPKPAHCSQIVYTNCQLIHLAHIALDIQTWWGSTDGGVDGLTLENIAVETEDDQSMPAIQPDFDTPYDFRTGFRPRLFVANMVIPTPEWGQLNRGNDYRVRMSYDNVLVRDIRVNGPYFPVSLADGMEGLTMHNLRMENITFNGKRLTNAEQLKLTVHPGAEVLVEDTQVPPCERT